MADLFETVAISSAAREGPVAEAVSSRSKVFEMTDAAERAVLAPRDPGRWSHDLRAAIAARTARLNRDEAMARRHAARIRGESFAGVADPADDGAEVGLVDVLRFADRVAASPRDLGAADIAGLQAAGISDADIVRLCELIAFVSYQLRLSAGLRLMQEAVQ